MTRRITTIRCARPVGTAARRADSAVAAIGPRRPRGNVFPNEAAVTRLASAVLPEIHDDWAIAERAIAERAIAERRYLAEGSMARLASLDDGGVNEVGAGALLLAS